MVYLNVYAGIYEFFNRLLSSWRVFWRYLPNRFYIFTALAFQVLLWWQAYTIKSSLSGELLVLRYKINFGANLVGDPSLIFRYALFALLVVLLNMVLAVAVSRHRNFRLLSHLLMGGALSFSFLTAFYLLTVYLVNFR